MMEAWHSNYSAKDVTAYWRVETAGKPFVITVCTISPIRTVDAAMLFNSKIWKSLRPTSDIRSLVGPCLTTYTSEPFGYQFDGKVGNIISHSLHLLCHRLRLFAPAVLPIQIRIIIDKQALWDIC